MNRRKHLGHQSLSVSCSSPVAPLLVTSGSVETPGRSWGLGVYPSLQEWIVNLKSANLKPVLHILAV
jgi:hypothetical protein